MPAITQRGVEIKLRKAEPLADLHSIAQDLKIAIHLCQEAIRLGAQPQHDSLLVEGLVTGALIRYFRCFSTSPRLGLRHIDIPNLGKRINERHIYFHGLRDKFVAHCINPFDEMWVTAMAVVHDGQPQPISALGYSGHRLMLSAVEASGIKILAEAVLRFVNRKIEIEKKKVLRLVQKLPLETIHGSDLRTPTLFRTTDVFRSRKQTVTPTAHSRRIRSK